jgi:RNA polymerase sigma factor (sigma-70 family)
MNEDLSTMDVSEELWRKQVVGLLDQSNRGYLLALRAINEPAIAEEAVQEAYAHLLQRAPISLSRDQLVLYFFKVVRGIAIKMSKSSHSRRLREKSVGSANSLSTSADDASLAAEATQAARQAMLRLPADDREIVSLCGEQGLSQKLASAVLGIPVPTVSRRLEQALTGLRETLKSAGFASMPASGANGLFSDNFGAEWSLVRFDRDHPLCQSEWVTEEGGWELQDGAFRSLGRESILVWKTDVPASFRFVCEGWVDIQAGELSIIGHRASPEFKNYSLYSGYYLQLGAEFNSCTKFARGYSDVLVRNGPELRPGKRYLLEMEYQDDKGVVLCSIDNKQIFVFRELAAFPGNRVGLYGWGRATRLRPLEIHIQNWPLKVPPLRAADRLFQYGHYSEAIEGYKQIASRHLTSPTLMEARLKIGICQVCLRNRPAALKAFHALAGAELEPYALAEEALMDMQGTPEDRPRTGVKLLQTLQKRFPRSQARARITDAAQQYRRMKHRYASTGAKDFEIRAELQRLAANSAVPPAGSQIKSHIQHIRFLLRLAQWKQAVACAREMRAKMHPAQARVPGFESAFLSAALAGGRDDLLAKSFFSMEHWIPLEWMDWSSAPIAHCAIRMDRQAEFLERFDAGESRSTGVSGDLIAMHVALSTTDTKYASKLLAHADALFSKNIFAVEYFWTGSSLVESRQAEIFFEWVKLASKRAADMRIAAYADTLSSLQARWHLEAGDLDRAAAHLKSAPPPASDIPIREPLVLQILLASVGRLKAPSVRELTQACKDLLTGTEFDLAQVFLGLKEARTIRWPAFSWRPEWRLWLATWLEARDEKRQALKIAQSARDKRYGLTHSQPAVEALIARL